ncbi:MAG: hypothetical protein ACSW8I_00370 [bacterium]
MLKIIFKSALFHALGGFMDKCPPGNPVRWLSAGSFLPSFSHCSPIVLQSKMGERWENNGRTMGEMS